MHGLLVLGALALASAGFAADLDALLAHPKLWLLNQEEFARLPESRGFQWTSNAHDSARAGEQALSLYKLPIVEVIVRFQAGRLAMINAVIYARGDSGVLAKEGFDELIKASEAALNQNTKAVPVERKDVSNAVNAKGELWYGQAAKFILESSATREAGGRAIPFRAEFVRLVITPPEVKPAMQIVSTINPNDKSFSGFTHVKKNMATGDVVITDVPMVDQGQKGYCAVACAERVFRYFGRATDANEIAKIANTDSTKGTSADAMFDALKKLDTKLKVRVRPVEKFEVKQMLAVISEYNRAAKSKNLPPIKPGSATGPGGPGPGVLVLDAGAIFHAMDPELLKEVRSKKSSEMAKFQADLQKYIDAGIPLIWSVQLGIFPEPDVPQSGGGHMRLIIGYNVQKQEVIFSDSWGAGHEQKRMPLDKAVAISMGLTAIEPM